MLINLAISQDVIDPRERPTVLLNEYILNGLLDIYAYTHRLIFLSTVGVQVSGSMEEIVTPG